MTTPTEDKTQSWYLKRMRNVFRYEGMSGFLLRSLAFMGYKCGIWVVGWYVKPIPEFVEPVEIKLPVKIDELAHEDIDDYLASYRVMTSEVLHKRLAAGGHCYVARYNNQIISTSWVATDNIMIDFVARDIRLSKGDIYVYDSYTPPSFRGQHIQAKLMAEIFTRYRAAGYQQVGVIIAPENMANIRSRTRSGFKRIAWVFAIKIGRFHWDSLGNRRIS